MTLDSKSLTAQALYVETYPVTVTPDPSAFTFADFVNPPNVKLSAPTTGGIDSLSFTMADASHGGITFTLRPPSALGQSTYTTPITVSVYADSTGDILVQTFMVTLQYVITNSYTVSGPNGYTITALPVATNGLAGIASQNAIYADVLTDAATGSYSVEALDPSTGASLYPPVTGASAGVLGLSDDGQFLYAGVGGNVERLDASSLAVDLTIPGVAANSLAVQPGQPTTVAVASTSALQIFDNAAARANSVPLSPNSSTEFGSLNSLQWGSSSTVYAAAYPSIPNAAEPDMPCPFAVDSSGVTFINSCGPSNTLGDGLTLANGLGYSPNGTIANPANWSVVGTFSISEGIVSGVTPDTTLGTAFAYVTGQSGGCWIQSFDLSTQAPIAAVRLPTVFNSGINEGDTCWYAVSTFTSGLNSLVRFGPNGLAIQTDIRGAPGYIIVITGAFVAPH